MLDKTVIPSWETGGMTCCDMPVNDLVNAVKALSKCLEILKNYDDSWVSGTAMEYYDAVWGNDGQENN